MENVVKAGALCGMLAFGAFMYSSLNVTADTFAEEGIPVDINVSVEPVISLSVQDDELLIDITPTAAGQTGSASTNVTVITNNLTGYTLEISTETEESGLINSSTDTAINRINTPAALSNIEANTWGFLKSDGLYHGVPSANESGAVLKQTSTYGTDQNTTLQIGTKVNNDTYGGSYTNTLVLTATPNV